VLSLAIGPESSIAVGTSMGPLVINLAVPTDRSHGGGLR
jgi:hypothetical protein